MSVSPKEAFAWPRDKVIVIDTETTGLDPAKDEVLSLAVTNADGKMLFYHLLKPPTRKRWPKATEIHGIRWQDVKDQKEIFDYEKELKPYFADGNLIVGYNVDFDLKMLRSEGVIIPSWDSFDVMSAYSDVFGEWSDWKKDRLFVKLEDCAKNYGYKFTAHSALEDAKATAHCFNAMQKDEKYLSTIEVREKAKREKEEAEKAKKKESEMGCAIGALLGLAAIIIGVAACTIS